MSAFVKHLGWVLACILAVLCYFTGKSDLGLIWWTLAGIQMREAGLGRL